MPSFLAASFEVEAGEEDAEADEAEGEVEK